MTSLEKIGTLVVVLGTLSVVLMVLTGHEGAAFGFGVGGALLALMAFAPSIDG